MHALALVESADHVCCRYRIRAFEPALRRAGWTLTIRGLAPGILPRWRQVRAAGRFETVILQRKLLAKLPFQQLRRQARRLVFDFDDAVLYRDSYDPRGPVCGRRARRFARTVRQADLVIAGNAFLAECARDAGAHPDRVRIIPTCIDLERYPILPRDCAAPGLQLVWIGSSSTLQGLERRRELWERLGREVPGLRLRLIGDRFPRFDPLPVEAVPWSADREAADLAAGDVGISWIPDDLWSRGKCGLKVLQYQAAALPVVANPVGVHPQMIAHGVTGVLAETADEWVAAVRGLADDPERRREMGRAARRAVEAGYSVEAHAPAFLAAVAGTGSPARTVAA